MPHTAPSLQKGTSIPFLSGVSSGKFKSSDPIKSISVNSSKTISTNNPKFVKLGVKPVAGIAKKIGWPARLSVKQLNKRKNNERRFIQEELERQGQTDQVANIHESVFIIGGVERLTKLMCCFYTEHNFDKLVAGEVNIEEKVNHVKSHGIEYVNAKLRKKYGYSLEDLNIPLETDTASVASDMANVAAKVWSDGFRLELELYLLQHDPRVLREPQFTSLMTYVELCGTMRLDKKLLVAYGHSMGFDVASDSALPPTFLDSSFRETYRTILIHVLHEFYSDVDPNRLAKCDVSLEYLADWIIKHGISKVNLRLMLKYGKDLTNFLEETPFWQRKRLLTVESTKRKRALTKESAELFDKNSRRVRANSDCSGLSSVLGRHSSVLGRHSSSLGKAFSMERNGRLRSGSEGNVLSLTLPSVNEINTSDNTSQEPITKIQGEKSSVLDPRIKEFYIPDEMKSQALEESTVLKQEIDLFLMINDPVAILDGLDRYMYQYGMAFGRELLSRKLTLKYGKGLVSAWDADETFNSGKRTNSGKVAKKKKKKTSKHKQGKVKALTARIEHNGFNHEKDHAKTIKPHGGRRGKQDGGKGKAFHTAPYQRNKKTMKNIQRDKKKFATLLGRENMTFAEVGFVKAWQRLANNESLPAEIPLDEI